MENKQDGWDIALRIVMGFLTLIGAMSINGLWVEYVFPLMDVAPGSPIVLVAFLILMAPIAIFQLLGAFTLGSFVLNKLEALKNRFKYGR